MTISELRQKSSPGHQTSFVFKASSEAWRNKKNRTELLDRIYYRLDFVLSKLSNFIVTPSGCWEYQGYRDEDGYGKFKIYLSDITPQKKNYRTHRLAFALVNGVDPDSGMVCHHCDNPACINPDHLYLGSAVDNASDMVSRGRLASQKGSNNNNATITESDVLEIVNLIKSGCSNRLIAEKTSATVWQVRSIRARKTWRHVLEKEGYRRIYAIKYR